MFIRLRVLLVLLIAGLGVSSASSAPSPAAFVAAIELKGADIAAGTAIRRGGEELRPRLLMPLYAGDVVFLREAGSRIVVETEAGAETEITGAGARFEVKGDATADGGFWSMLGAVADAVSDDSGEIAPDNMMSRDTEDVINVPMAVRGANQIVSDGKPVWIAWRGGTAPYRLSISAGRSDVVQDNILDEEFSFSLPPSAPRRVKVVIEDAGGRKATVLLRLSDKRPESPFEAASGSPHGSAKRIAYAAWLTSLDDGGWSVEAARLLREDAAHSQPAALLLHRIAEGWKAGAGG